MCIVNTDTLSVISSIDRRLKQPHTAVLRHVDIHPSEDDYFFALLGSENGKGIARMLADFPHFYGRKTITKVRVYPSSKVGPALCWFLEEVEEVKVPMTPTKNPLSRKEKRNSTPKKDRSEQRKRKREESRNSSISSLFDEE